MRVAPDYDCDVSAAFALHRRKSADSRTGELLAPLVPIEGPQGLGAFDANLGQHHIREQRAPGDLIMLVVPRNRAALVPCPIQDLGILGPASALP